MKIKELRELYLQWMMDIVLCSDTAFCKRLNEIIFSFSSDKHNTDGSDWILKAFDLRDRFVLYLEKDNVYIPIQNYRNLFGSWFPSVLEVLVSFSQYQYLIKDALSPSAIFQQVVNDLSLQDKIDLNDLRTYLSKKED